MTKFVSYFSHHITLPLRLISALILSGCALWLGLRAPVDRQKSLAPANPLPELHGQPAVEHLKREGLYDTLAEAVAAAQYNADPLPSPGAYQFSNHAQGLRATFTSSGMRVVSSPGGRDRELTFKLIGYGYGSRITNLDSRNIVARQNRIEHEYSQSAIRNPQSAIIEWFVNSEAGIEHGFTLPGPPPAERDGDEALRVEMEIGGEFEPRLDTAGQAVSFACGRRCGVLTYNKLRVYDAREREVEARFELEGKRLAIVVEDGEAEYPLTIDPLFSQQAKLTASDASDFGEFGRSVAISGDTAVIGAPFATIDGRIAQGAAYIFVRDLTTSPPSWTQQAKLTASDGISLDSFGFSVAISGDTAVVGAPPGVIEETLDQGDAYIFVRDATTTPPSWTQQAKLTARDGPVSDLFGISVAIDGDTVVVGDNGADIAPNVNQGAAYVFVRNATTSPPSWFEQAKLTASDGGEFDLLGFSVAIEGDTAVAGAVVADIAPNFDQGAVYIFVRDATTTPPSWTQQAKLTASDRAFFDEFGFSVAIDGNTVVVGAVNADVVPNANQGAAYIFVRDATTTPPSWTQQMKLTAMDGAADDSFGFSVTIAGDTVVVGAVNADVVPNANQGAAYVFVRDSTTSPPSWTEQEKLTASDGAASDLFGPSVAIDGNTVLVGALGAGSSPNFDQGAAYVFVSCPEIIVNPTGPDLPEGAVGQPYIQSFTASAGSAPLGFTVITGALPPGLNLAMDGTLSGAPISFGTFNFTVQARDAKGCTGAHAYLLVINNSTCPTITVNPETLPPGITGLPYNQTLTASGGTAPIPFSVLSGSPPPGLTLSSTGVLSGPPMATGVFNFTALATDANGCAGARAYTVTIAPSAFATVSAASYTSPVTAKEIVAGFGVSLANTIAFASSLPLPTSLAGVSVKVRDRAGVERVAGLFFISPFQVNYQIPTGTALGSATVSVSAGPNLVAASPVLIVATAPSIFTLNASGSGPAAALDAITFQPAPFNATRPGGSPNFIAVFGTGLGEDVTDGGGNISAEVQALIDGNPVTVTYAGQAPFLVGANQFNIQFPVGIMSGEHTLTISRGGAPSNVVTIAIR